MSTWRNKIDGDVAYSGYLPADIAETMRKAQRVTNESTYVFIDLAVAERAERILKQEKSKNES